MRNFCHLQLQPNHPLRLLQGGYGGLHVLPFVGIPEPAKSDPSSNFIWLETSIALRQAWNVADAAVPPPIPPNRDRGSSYLLSPPTPPGMRVRTGRFEKLRFTPCSLCEGAGVGLHHCPELTWLHLAPSGLFRQCGHLMPFPTHRLPKNHSFSFGPSLTFASYYGLG